MAFGDFGSSYPSTAPGAAFHQWDAVSKRRFNVGNGGQRPSWDINPAQSGLSGSLPSSTSSAPASAGSIEDSIRNIAMGGGLARASGARLSAANANPNDPSLAAYGGLMGQLSGQSDASNRSQEAMLAWQQQKWEEDQMRLRYKLEEEAARKAASGQWLSTLGGLAGTVGGAMVGGPVGASIGGSIGGSAGKVMQNNPVQDWWTNSPEYQRR